MNRPVVITVSGACAKAGKTLLIEKLLPAFGNAAAVKAQVREDHDFSLTEESDSSESPGKDTSRYLAAGARRAFLISGPRDRVAEAVNEMISRKRFDVIIIESNTMAIHLESDISFFVRGEGPGKPGAEECEKRADMVVSSVSLKNRRH